MHLLTLARRRPGVAFAVLLVALAGMGDAAAHARLQRSSPAADAELSQSPATIELWFNEQPEAAFSRVDVQDEAGNAVPVGTLAAAADGNGLVLTLEASLAAGRYTVHYRVLSVDGHVIEDQFVFRIASTP